MNCSLCHNLSVNKLFIASNKHGRHLWNKDDLFEFFRCHACGVVFIADLVPDDKYYSKYYPANYYNDEHKNRFLNNLIALWSKVSFASKSGSILNSFRHPCTDKLRILDIGCGRGDFLARFDPQRFDRTGVEINATGIASTKEKGINVFKSLHDVISTGFYFDIVTLWHALEHLANPSDTLAQISKIMDKDGILTIATPNTDSIGFKLGQKDWFHLDAPRHLRLYNPKSIELLLKKSGFEVTRYCNPFYDYPLDLFWSVSKRPWKFIFYLFYPFLKLVSCETLMVICKKKDR